MLAPAGATIVEQLAIAPRGYAVLSAIERLVALSAAERVLIVDAKDRAIACVELETPGIISATERRVLLEAVMIAGNTMRFTAEFRDWSNALADPTALTFRLSDARGEIVLGPVVLGPANKVSLARWSYDAVLPSDTIGVHTYEFVGTLEGSHVRSAKQISITGSSD